MGAELSTQTLQDVCHPADHPVYFRETVPGLYAFGVPFHPSKLEVLVNPTDPKRRKMTRMVTLLMDPIDHLKDKPEREDRPGCFRIQNGSDGEWYFAPKNLLDSTRDQLAISHIPVVDGEFPSTEKLCEFIQLTRREIHQGNAVGVHCWMGRGRTSSMAAAYIVAELTHQKKKVNKDEVWQLIWPDRYRIGDKGRVPGPTADAINGIIAKCPPELTHAYAGAISGVKLLKAVKRVK